MAPILSRRLTARQTRGVDEFGDCEFRVMGVGEQSGGVVCGADTEDIGVRVEIPINADSYVPFHYFRHYPILRNEI